MLAAALAAVAIPADGLPAGAAQIRRYCGQYQHFTVRSRAGTAFVVRNDFWGTRSVCLQNSGLRPNFRVIRTGRNAIHGKVVSFPYIMRGCSWGVCSPGGRLPARVGSLRKPQVSWHISARARGRWNASLETWYGKRDSKTGQADGAELMIWVNTRNLPRSSTRRVRIDGTWWYLAHWKARGQGKTWHYIQFRRVRRASRVIGLKLWPFIKKAEHLHLIKPWWWLLNIEAGFEIWNGGKGLGTKSFWARP